MTVFGDFHRQCTADRPVTIGVQNSMVAIGPKTVNYYEHASDLVIAGPFISVLLQRLEYGNDDMPNIPKALLFRDIKT